MTVGLLTVTYDEPLTLPTMLASVRDLVDGPAVGLHIGENDETAEILHDFGAEVHRDKWEDFDGTWNKAFALIRNRCDRILYMGADHTLEQDGPLPEMSAEVPCYMVRYRRGPYEYRLDNLLRGDIEWGVNAPVHGIIVPCYGDERLPLDGVYVQEHDTQNRRPEKIQRYLPICEKMVAENPTPRAIFYLARTYFDLGRFEEAIETYSRRVNMGGWEEEAWHAQYMMGVAQIRLARFAEGRNTLLAAYLRRPTRAEPLHAICKSMNPPGDDLLFIETDVYAP